MCPRRIDMLWLYVNGCDTSVRAVFMGELMTSLPKTIARGWRGRGSGHCPARPQKFLRQAMLPIDFSPLASKNRNYFLNQKNTSPKQSQRRTSYCFYDNSGRNVPCARSYRSQRARTQSSPRTNLAAARQVIGRWQFLINLMANDTLIVISAALHLESESWPQRPSLTA